MSPAGSFVEYHVAPPDNPHPGSPTSSPGTTTGHGFGTVRVPKIAFVSVSTGVVGRISSSGRLGCPELADEGRGSPPLRCTSVRLVRGE